MRIPNALKEVLPAHVVKNTTFVESHVDGDHIRAHLSRTYLTAVTARGATAAGAKAATEVARIAPRARVNFIVAIFYLKSGIKGGVC